MSKADLQTRVVNAIKAVTASLGRTPSRDEFYRHESGVPITWVREAFGMWTEALKASGLEQNKPGNQGKPKKPVLELSKESAKILYENSRSVRTVRITSYKRILVIGDVHYPFANPDSLSMIYALCERLKPDVVVQVGDLYDMFSSSKFPRSLNVMTPRAEMEMAREQAVEMWAKIRGMLPGSTLFQCVGNHDIRAASRIMERWPEGEDFIKKAMEPLLTFDGVTTIFDPTEELVIDDIWFIHGYRSKLGDHANYNRKKTVCGHSHRGGVFYKPSGDEIIWELNAGFVADPFSAALSYRKQRLHDWTQGCGFVDDLGPRFIPFA